MQVLREASNEMIRFASKANSFACRYIYRSLSISKYATETYQIPPRSDLVNSLKTNKEFDLLIIGGGATGSGIMHTSYVKDFL